MGLNQLVILSYSCFALFFSFYLLISILFISNSSKLVVYALSFQLESLSLLWITLTNNNTKVAKL